MAIFDSVPYTNFHELNADWIMEQISDVTAAAGVIESYEQRISDLESSDTQQNQDISDLGDEIQTVDAKIVQATPTTAGTMKLYSTTGTNTDGTMTQAAIIQTIRDSGGSGIIVDSALDTTSTNPVQNKIIASALDTVNTTLNDLADDIAAITYSPATQSSDGLMSALDKIKLDGIESGAQVNTITGIKGEDESTYRTGNVSLSKANIGITSGTTLPSASDGVDGDIFIYYEV